MLTQLPVSLPQFSDTSFFGHPRGLSTLFLTELWERFSFYGMRALLILYMTAKWNDGGLGFDVTKASAIYGLYTAGVYLSALPGGWLADHLFGLRRAVLYGGVLIALGHYSLALGGLRVLYTGLFLIVVGTGLLKPNVSALMGQLYSENDHRRDSGFSIFYMGINVGSFLAPLACGYLGQKIGWHLGFGLAAVGMTAALTQFLAGTKHLPHTEPNRNGRKRLEFGAQLRRIGIACGATVLLFILLARNRLLTITAESLSAAMGLALVTISVAIFFWFFGIAQWTTAERRRLVVVLALFLASAVFWSLLEQSGSTLNLFAERNTQKSVLGFSFPASWLQALDPLFIIVLAPVFAWLWLRLGTKNPPCARKFALGLLFAGLGYAILILPAYRATRGLLVSPLWLTGTYLLHTIGELCLSPVGLSAMTQLAPRRVMGMMMGVWFLSTSVGNYIGGRFASFYDSLPLPTLFTYAALMALLAGTVLAVLAAPIHRLTAPSEQHKC